VKDFLHWILFLPPQGSTVARQIDWLHYFVILVTTGGAILVTLVGGYFLIRYRRSTQREPPRVEAATVPAPWFEYGVIVGLFVLFVGWWWIGTRQYSEMRVAPEGATEVYVTAKQWMWKFGYPDGTGSLATLYVPANTPVKLVMTSRDVIHSFYVPDFRIKQDVVPGRYTTAWFEAVAPGSYQILCTEYCGTDHSRMRGEVIALEPADYARWLAGAAPRREGEAATATEGDLLAQGRLAAARHGCLRCHSIDGTPHLGPTWAGMYGSVAPLERGESITVDDAYITESMMDPQARLHRGYQPIMPSYLGLIQPAETAGIIEYIRSLEGTGRDGAEGSP
jgi:cytochrome c oxidase subunit II